MSLRRKLLVLFAFAGLVVLLVACGGSGSTPTATVATNVEPTATTASQAQPTSASGPATSQGGLGAPQELDNFKVTVNSVRRESTGNINPKPGNEFVLVNATVENTANDSQTVSSLMMLKLTGENGQKFDETVNAKINGQLDADVAAGKSLTGEVAYEVPKGAKGLKFTFAGILSQTSLVFDLGQ